MAEPVDRAASGQGYLRRLGPWDGVMIVMGGVIGSGIFRTPVTVAQLTSSSFEQLLLWALGGLLTLAGVLCYAELGSRRPQAGGTYVYLREAFGRLPAFLFGWTMALINYPGSIAAVAVTFADYFCAAAGLSAAWVRPVAFGAIALLALIHLRGIQTGAWIQNLFTSLKLMAILLVVLAGLWLAHGAPAGAAPDHPPLAAGSMIGALLPVLFAYGGFHYLNDLAGEVREPQRSLPRALGLGMLGVMLCYVLVNLAYLLALGHAGLAASNVPAAELLQRAFGSQGRVWISIGIACSTFGYCNIAIAGGARVVQTMSADGLLLQPLARLSPRRRVPQIALLALAAWAGLLALTHSFARLLDYTTVGEWLAHAFGIATLFWYRRHCVAEPAFRVPLYPMLPLLFVATVLLVIAATAIRAPGEAGMSLLLIGLGVPVYALRRRWRGSPADAS